MPQPTDKLAFRGSPELGEGPVRFQKDILDNVGGIDLPLQPPADLHTGQDRQITPAELQELTQGGTTARLSQTQKLFRVWRAAGAHSYSLS
jgi:hypothetical protein